MKVELPILPVDTELAEAIENLRKWQKAALVAEYEGQPCLYSAGNIVVGFRKGKKTLGELQPDETLGPMRAGILSYISPASLRRRWTKTFAGSYPQARAGNYEEDPAGNYQEAPAGDYQQASARNYIVAATDTTATLHIANNDIGQRYVSGPSDYYCDGPPHHPFPPPSVVVDQTCPIDELYKIVSSR